MDITTDDDVRVLVHAFYEKVRKDERLGYIFNDFAEVDWHHHLPNMIDFWSNLLFQTGRYKGRPFQKHLPLPIQKDDFGRWLELFNDTVDEHFKGEKAMYARVMAAKIAASFAIRLEVEKKF